MDAALMLLELNRSAAGRTGSGVTLRQNALDPGFHGVPAGPAHTTVMLMVPVCPEPGFLSEDLRYVRAWPGVSREMPGVWGDCCKAILQEVQP